MNPVLVLDCSVTMSWLFADEATEETNRVQEALIAGAAIVPAHWGLEVVNVLAMAEKRGRVTRDSADEFLQLLCNLDIRVGLASNISALPSLLEECRAHKLTSYDAAYLELAVDSGLPLATLDVQLRAAAQTVGVVLLGK